MGREREVGAHFSAENRKIPEMTVLISPKMTVPISPSQEELSARIGKNRSTIANSLRLLKLPGNMRQAIYSQKLTPGHARAILSVINPADQRILFNRIAASGLSVREAETLAADLNKGVRASEKPAKDKLPKQKIPGLKDMEQKLLDVFGTKVQIKGNGNKGCVEIAYFPLDDLEHIYSILLGGR